MHWGFLFWVVWIRGVVRRCVVVVVVVVVVVLCCVVLYWLVSGE